MFSLISVYAVLAVFKFAYCSRVLDVHGVRTVLAVEHEELLVPCQDDAPMAYCGFTHPNGTRYSFASGNLNNGQCHMKLNASRADSGAWTCHVGKQDASETTQTVNVRVGGKLVAVEPNLTVDHGADVTLDCKTAQRMQPVDYCRFLPPSGNPFAVIKNVHGNNTKKGRFYFPPDRSMDRGDCAVTITHAKDADDGVWTCDAWVEEELLSGEDTIHLRVNGMYISPETVFGAMYGAIGIAVLITLFIGGLSWFRSRDSRNPSVEIEIQDFSAPRILITSPSPGSTTPNE